MDNQRADFRSQGEDLVFNLVWTGTVFDHLRYFAASQMAHSSARFRFVANACPPDQIAAMEAFAAEHPGRVVEVLEVSTDRMVRHGDALDVVLQTRDDGPFFAFVDPDIIAQGPYLDRFVELLADVAAVTSGKEVWSDHNVRPAEHPGVNGEYFYDQDGYVFGSPHFAIYRRGPLLDTLERWGVGFSSGGNDISEAARAQLVACGRDYWIFDTAKIVNVLLQGDGHELVHYEEPALLHIGSLSLYISPPSTAPAARGKPGWGEDWSEQDENATRYMVARYTSEVLAAVCEGRPAPELPPEVDAGVAPRLALVRTALIELLAAYREPVADEEAP